MSALPDIAIGAIGAALITGTATLLSLVISKEQKVSEFRQAWIDSLRAEISKLIAHTNAIYGAYTSGFRTADEMWKIAREDFVALNDATSNIRLRLNPKEVDSIAVLDAIEELEDMLSPTLSADHQDINRVEKQLAVAAQRLLKSEWQRVRSGERMYRIARWSSVFLVVAGFGALSLMVLDRVGVKIWF